jgi:hypothetical protein
MGLRLGVSALFAWKTQQPTVANCVTNRCSCAVFSGTGGTPFALIFRKLLFSFWSLKSLHFVSSRLFPSVRRFVTGLNIALGAVLAFAKVAVCHLRMFVEVFNRLFSPALEASFSHSG